MSTIEGPICAACSVYRGTCPACGTFWTIVTDGLKQQRLGMRPTNPGVYGQTTSAAAPLPGQNVVRYVPRTDR